MADQQIDKNLWSFLTKPYFYTLQEHLPTQKKQLSMWSNITFTYFIKKNIYEFSRAQLEAEDFGLFHNKKISRSLNKNFIDKILSELEASHKIEFKSANRNTFFVLKTSVDDLAEAIYKWAKSTARIGKIETIQYLCTSEDVESELFWGYPEEILLNACKVLETRGKVELFDLSDEENTNMMGVKFK